MLTILALITVVGMAHQLTFLLEYVVSDQAGQEGTNDGWGRTKYYLHMVAEFSRVLCPMALAICVLVQ